MLVGLAQDYFTLVRDRAQYAKLRKRRRERESRAASLVLLAVFARVNSLTMAFSQGGQTALTRGKRWAKIAYDNAAYRTGLTCVSRQRILKGHEAPLRPHFA